MEKLNKIRSKISIISLIGTITIVGLYVISIIIFAPHFMLTAIIGFILVLFLLYLWSSLVIKKQYNKLKVLMYKEYLTNRFKVDDIKESKNKDNLELHFYDKRKVSINLNYNLIYKNLTINIKEIEIIESKLLKSSVSSSFRLISFDYNSENMAFLASNFNETELFEEYYQNSLKSFKIDTLDNGKHYKVLYNSLYTKDLANKLVRLPSFNMLVIENNRAYILYFDKTQLFDFKLQYQIDENVINHLYECNELLIKQVKELIK